MLVIHKKRIQIILACLVIGIFTFVFEMANTKEKIKENTNAEPIQQDTITTTATPVSGKTIIIDAGHGTPDERCTK